MGRKYFNELKPLNKEEANIFAAIKQDRIENRFIPPALIKLEIGIGLVPLADKDLLSYRIRDIRGTIENEIGIRIPSINIIINPHLNPFEYALFINGKELKQLIKYEIKPGKYLCLNPNGDDFKLEGETDKDPTFGLPCIYISKEQIDEALSALYTVVDSATILIVSIQEFIKRNISEIFTHSYSKNILESVSRFHPLLLEDCYAQFDLDEIKNILNKIIKKAGTLSNIDEILELLLLYSKDTKDCDKIVELVLNDSRIKNGG